MSIRIVVVDDHPVVLQGLREALAGSEIEIVAEAEDSQSAIDAAATHIPDALLMDVRLPEVDGIKTAQTIRKTFPEMPVVFFTGFDNSTYVARAMSLGNAEFLLKGATPYEIIEAIQRIVAGAPAPDEAETVKIAGMMTMRDKTQRDRIRLTGRETQVLRHVALGLKNHEIAELLEISAETVKEHLQSIFRKLDARDRTHAAVWAVRNGIV